MMEIYVFQDEYNIGLYICVISVESCNLGFPTARRQSPNLVLTTILISIDQPAAKYSFRRVVM